MIQTEAEASGRLSNDTFGSDITRGNIFTVDWDIVNAQGIEPRSEWEERALQTLSPVDHEIVRHRLFQIMDEGRSTVVRLGADPVIHDAEEVGFFYFSASGDVASAAAGIVWHGAGTPATIKYIKKHFMGNPRVGVYDEDYFFNNETLYGGTHPPDQLICTPVFRNGQLIAWVGALTHESETGAVEPGGMAPSATNKYSDGLLRTPPIKIVERGLVREDVLTWMAMSVRDPRTVLLDQRAKMAGLFRGKKRLIELCDKFGDDVVVASLRKSIEDSAERMRTKLLSYPDGIYRSVFFQDRGRVGEHALFKIPFAVIKRGDKMVVDLHGASPQQPHSYNIAGPAVKAFLFGPLCNYCYDVEWNSGILANVDVRPPAYRSVVSPDQHAALSCGVTQGIGCSEVARKAFSLMQFDSPDRVEINAPWSAQQTGPVYGGANQYGIPVAGSTLEHIGMGTGAWSDGDGVDMGGESFSPVANTGDAEAWEDDVPLINLDYRYEMDMVGYGRWQGGISQVTIQMIWNVDELEWCSWGYGDAFHISPGLYGGYPGPCYQVVFIEDNDFLERVQLGRALPAHWMEYTTLLSGRMDRVPATNAARIGRRGDIRLMHLGGGSGYGDVLDREPDRVVCDLKNLIISDWTARNIYKIDYDPTTLTANEDVTRELRERARRERLETAVPFERFEAQRKGVAPDQAFLEWYGEWSDARYEQELVHSRDIYRSMSSVELLAEEVFMPELRRRQVGEYLGLDVDEEVFFCWKCDRELGAARDVNFKQYLLINERPPSEVYPPWPGFSGRDDMCVIREFYCPGCGTMMETECVPPGHPVMHDLEIDIDSLRQRLDSVVSSEGSSGVARGETDG